MLDLSRDERIHLVSRISNLISEKGYSENLFYLAQAHNPWFDARNQSLALQTLAEQLCIEKVSEFMKTYPNTTKVVEVKRVGLILAGNIPLVGLQDILYVFLAGYKSIIKLSSQDDVWIPYLIKELIKEEPRANAYFEFVEKLQDFDAVIATGSNNSARYFEHYFGKKPNIIRKNRNSVAILTGEEGKEEYKKLGADIFNYYGLGCRSISKIYVPKNFDFPKFIDQLESFSTIIDFNKYRNNYDYNKSIFLLNKVMHYDNGFLLICENKALVSSIACLNYEFYEDLDSLNAELESMKDSIQCITRKHPKALNEVPFGNSQCPGLDDYADGIDVMEFLLVISE